MSVAEKLPVLEGQPEYRVSVSRLKTLDCPAFFKWKYVDRNEEPPTVPTVLGKLVHGVIERAINYFQETGQVPKNPTIKPWVEEAEAEARASGLFNKTALSDIGRLARRGIKRLGAILKIPNAKVMTELHFVVPVIDTPTTELQGFIDLLVIDPLTSTGYVYDWKTNRKPYSVEEDKGHQLPLYGLALSQLYPSVARWELELNFLRFESITRAVYTPEMGLLARQYLADKVSFMDQLKQWNHYPARPGAMCVGCPAAVSCPAASQSVDLQPDLQVIGREHAQELFGQLLAVEARRDLLREALRKWVTENGDLELGGRQLGFITSAPSKEVTDLPGLVQLIMSLGLEPYRYLQANVAAVTKLAAEQPEVAVFLKEKPGSRRFEHRVAQG